MNPFNGMPKMLIVEDNDDTANVEISTFETLGFNVRRVSDGSQAVSTMREYNPQIVLLDLELPGCNGDEIAKQMLEDPQLKKIPVVVYSVHISDLSSDNLGRKYFTAQYAKTGNLQPYIVKKDSGKDPLLDLICEIQVAFGEAYRVIPRKLQDFIDKKSKEINTKDSPPDMKVV